MISLRTIFALLCVAIPAFAVAADDEKVFSGPQVGEKLTSFKVQGVYDDVAGKELDFVAAAEAKPIMLIFVHDLTRPSLGMTRVLSDYGVKRAKDGLYT